ncbi:MAG: hypothetical protein ACRDV4_12290, partial [Acidimicrobiales bacterium]
TLNDLMFIGGIVALAGALLSYVLVRQKDFVATGIAGAAAEAAGRTPEPAAENAEKTPAAVGADPSDGDRSPVSEPAGRSL